MKKKVVKMFAKVFFAIYANKGTITFKNCLTPPPLPLYFLAWLIGLNLIFLIAGLIRKASNHTKC